MATGPITSLTPVIVTRETNSPCDYDPVPATPCGPIDEATPCAENHSIEIVTVEYAAGITSSNAWAIPACNQQARIVFPGLRTAHIGSWIFSADYGNFQIQGFNPAVGELIVVNPCLLGTAAPGTVVPIGSVFVISPPPCALTDNITAYLKTDLIIPAVGGCVTVKVTSTDDVEAGFDVTFGIGKFHVSSVIDGTTLQICNNGFAGNVGAKLEAKNLAGDYQYPMRITNSSVTIGNSTVVSNVVLSNTTPTQQAIVTVTYVNPSSTKAAQLFYAIESEVKGTAVVANTNIFSYRTQLLQTLDGVTEIGVVDVQSSKLTPNDTASPTSKNIGYDGVASVGPLGSITIKGRVLLTWSGSGAAAFNIETLIARISALAVIS